MQSLAELQQQVLAMRKNIEAETLIVPVKAVHKKKKPTKRKSAIKFTKSLSKVKKRRSERISVVIEPSVLAAIRKSEVDERIKRYAQWQAVQKTLRTKLKKREEARMALEKKRDEVEAAMVKRREEARTRPWRFEKKAEEVESITTAAAGGGGGGGGGGELQQPVPVPLALAVDGTMAEDVGAVGPGAQAAPEQVLESDEVFGVREILTPPQLLHGFYCFPCLWVGCPDEVQDFALTSDLIANCKTRLRLACRKAKINFDSQQIQGAP